MHLLKRISVGLENRYIAVNITIFSLFNLSTIPAIFVSHIYFEKRQHCDFKQQSQCTSYTNSGVVNADPVFDQYSTKTFVFSAESFQEISTHNDSLVMDNRIPMSNRYGRRYFINYIEKQCFSYSWLDIRCFFKTILQITSPIRLSYFSSILQMIKGRFVDF